MKKKKEKEKSKPCHTTVFFGRDFFPLLEIVDLVVEADKLKSRSALIKALIVSFLRDGGLINDDLSPTESVGNLRSLIKKDPEFHVPNLGKIIHPPHLVE